MAATMPLILRTMNRHAEVMGYTTGWSPDDYVVLDQDKTVGRIHIETIHGEPRWLWSINTSPYVAPPPHTGMANSLEDAKQALKVRYEEMKRNGVRTFTDDPT
jgi:hypothetical protein